MTMLRKQGGWQRFKSEILGISGKNSELFSLPHLLLHWRGEGGAIRRGSFSKGGTPSADQSPDDKKMGWNSD